VIFKVEERDKEIKKQHEQVRYQIEKLNEQCKAKAYKNHTHLDFEPRDLIWLHLRKVRFPSRKKSNLMARGDGPYKIVQMVRDNAHKIELSGDINISSTFNIRDLTAPILRMNLRAMKI